MNDYNAHREYTLRSFTFKHRDQVYKGHGTMTWDPKAGFHIGGSLDESAARPTEVSFGGERFIDSTPVFLDAPGHGKAVTRVFLTNEFELFLAQRLSVDAESVVFSAKSRLPSSNNWHGSALFETKSSPMLSDKMETAVRVGRRIIARKYETKGITYSKRNMLKVVGRMVDDSHLELHWSLPKTRWTKAESWRWPESAGSVLSMLLGETVAMLRREVHWDGMVLSEVRKAQEVRHLGRLAPFPSDGPLNKHIFAELTNYLAHGGANARICRLVLDRLADGSRQRNWNLRELAVATTLEAVLRTVYQQPYSAKTGALKKDLICRFQHDYLSDEWTGACGQAMKAWGILRTRNAHPDWLQDKRGAMSAKGLNEAARLVEYLSRFYGFIILALAGFKGLKPNLPVI